MQFIIAKKRLKASDSSISYDYVTGKGQSENFISSKDCYLTSGSYLIMIELEASNPFLFEKQSHLEALVSVQLTSETFLSLHLPDSPHLLSYEHFYTDVFTSLALRLGEKQFLLLD